MQPRLCRLAVVQHAPVFLNLARTFERVVALISEAIAQRAEVIVFPETWLPGYPVWLDDAPTAGLWDYEPAKALYQVLADNAISVPGSELDWKRRRSGIPLVLRLCLRSFASMARPTGSRPHPGKDPRTSRVCRARTPSS